MKKRAKAKKNTKKVFVAEEVRREPVMADRLNDVEENYSDLGGKVSLLREAVRVASGCDPMSENSLQLAANVKIAFEAYAVSYRDLLIAATIV